MPHDLNELKTMFAKSRESITAIGDETRQAIIIVLMEGPTNGMRVGDITTHTHLSQPAVSHHLKILCDANILTMSKLGTMNFYKINPDKAEITNMRDLCQGILDSISLCEEQSYPDLGSGEMI